VVGAAVGIRRHSIVIHIGRFESYWGRRIVCIEYCFIKWRKVRVYAIQVGAGIVAANNGPGREWMPDIGLRRIRIADCPMYAPAIQTRHQMPTLDSYHSHAGQIRS
jgi:hypothetical protein